MLARASRRSSRSVRRGSRCGRAPTCRRSIRGGGRARHRRRATDPVGVTLAWAAAAGVIAAASFVMGLAGFGIALVALAFLPYLIAASDAIVLLTIYAAVMSLAMLVQLRESVEPRAMLDLVVGTIAGTPLGVWGLSALPPGSLNRWTGLVFSVRFWLEPRGSVRHKPRGLGWAWHA